MSIRKFLLDTSNMTCITIFLHLQEDTEYLLRFPFQCTFLSLITFCILIIVYEFYRLYIGLQKEFVRFTMHGLKDVFLLIFALPSLTIFSLLRDVSRI